MTYKTNIDKNGFEKGLSSIKASTVAAGHIMADAIKDVIGKVVELGKSAVNSYADLEQNVGGVETLFKKSSDKVIKNAQKAYKTAGLSANNYMATVTGFSASLLQSLAGDTEKAADVADMALIDMADNANKFGTSMESIQLAYQGFAKQNYTMLDNLKLGYGGTKEEMQRLLADAQKITGIKYDISSLNDIFQAIHVIQQELDVTGTTAKEAEETISGSVASMKAAWDNFLNGSGTFDQFVDSAKIAFENIAKAVAELLPRIAKEIAGAIPKEFIDKVKEVIPYLEGIGIVVLSWKIGKTVQKIIKSFQQAKLTLALFTAQANGATIAQGLFNGALTLGETLVGLLTGKVTLAQIASAGLAKAQAILNAVMSANPIMLIVLAIGALVAAFVVLWNKCEWFRNFWIGLWDGIVSAAQNAWNGIVDIWNVVTQWFEDTIISPVSDFFDIMWNKLIDGASNAWQGIKNVFSNITNWFRDKFSEAWNAVKNVFSTGGKIFTGITEGITATFRTVVRAIIDGINKVIKKPFDAINGVLNNIRTFKLPGGAQPFSGLPRIDTPQIPLPQLARGIGLAKKGHQYLLEGQGNEAVIPLDQNQYWTKAVAADMLKAINEQKSVASSNAILKNTTENRTILINNQLDGTVEIDSTTAGRLLAKPIMKVIKVGG